MTRGSYLDTIGLPEDDDIDPELSVDFSVFFDVSATDVRCLARQCFPSAESSKGVPIQQFFGRLWLQLHLMSEKPEHFRIFENYWEALSDAERERMKELRKLL